MELTECSETSAYKIQTTGNYSEENIQQQRYFRLEHVFRQAAAVYRTKEGICCLVPSVH
jgi:hypothetical protein